MKHTKLFRSMFTLGLALSLIMGLGGQSAFAAESTSTPVDIKASGSSTTRSIGSVRVGLSDPSQSANAVSVTAEAGATAEVSVESIEASGSFPTALYVCGSDAGSVSRVSVQNGILAQGDDTAFGIAASSFDGGTAEVTVNAGGVSASADYAFGLHARNFGGGTVTLAVSGDVSAKGQSQARGVVMTAPESGSLSVTVNGTVSASGGGDRCAAELELNEGTAGSVTLIVNGDVSCSSSALAIRNYSDKARATVVVNGTIKGGESSVRVSKLDNTDNIRLIAWKIARSSQGNTVENSAGAAAGGLQSAVEYILRTAIPEGVKLGVTGVNYQEDLGLYTAAEGTEIMVYVEVPAGAKLAGVFNGEKELTQQGDGGYRLVVPRGGGVELRVELK